MKTTDLHIRDPFVLVDREKGLYVLYAQSGNRAGSGYTGVEAYTSRDLQVWTAPRPVLELPASAGVQAVWAPEVHAYGEGVYLFVTLTQQETLPQPRPVDDESWPEMHVRGTHILYAEGPLGPFRPLKEGAHTPAGWMALDGTLHVEGGVPYLVFCHEWVQIVDGTVDAVRLTPDLSDVAGAPRTLFRASDAPGGGAGGRRGGRVTDGPFTYTSPGTGRLWMIWSTFLPGSGYCVILARSESGRIAGPWTQARVLYRRNGGHAMLFCSLEGELWMALHQPNERGRERMRLYRVVDLGETLAIEQEA